MPNSFSISEAQLVSSWVTTIFWSFFLITFVKCLRALLLDEWRTDFQPRSAINWSMVAVSVSFFVFGTLDVVLGFYHNIKAFILYTGPGGSDGEFTKLSDWVNVMKGVNLLMQTLIGDGVLIYRLWVVYSRSWKVIALPILLWLSTGALAGRILFGEITTATGTVRNSNIKEFTIPLWICTIVLNITATSFLVYRIIRVDRENSQNGVLSFGSNVSPPHARKKRSRLQRIIFIIVESGLMYTFITFITVIVSNSNARYITSDVEVQVVGIAFNLIIIRVADRGASDKSLYTTGLEFGTQSTARRPMDKGKGLTNGIHVHLVGVSEAEKNNGPTTDIEYGRTASSSSHEVVAL
ncbi:hypothetical protein GALMADRAFT_147729 [Galerina marginata CBS 339.88]|uniref:G-protein coupled receptors family 1 profile domain-containing protein n=1 Tax=Galerina marginata (strain CBS 339.88) TaxID=685588 RepID=A0A067S746_GALM3|nr:hypothetical protein GALMADRAFT_147729 [Galerina marginata CBS 339.88]